jgi:uncharacterized protein YyaL (SSP411 family)
MTRADCRLILVLASALLITLMRAESKNADRKLETAAKIEWVQWTDDIFKRAKAENRLVLLDLGAVWCHWCHVMEETTYRDAEVVRIIGKHFIAVQVDQDSRPDLSNRYEDYGWPATILFAPDGTELAKRSGYIPPKGMASMLQAFVDDPTPGPSVRVEAPPSTAAGTTLSEATRDDLMQRLVDAYDPEDGGWGDAHHFLNWDAIEFCLSAAAAGDTQQDRMARQTLTSGLKLLDPVWGGVYQYSTHGDWDHPHFEKIMPFQAENLRIFAQAHTLWREPVWLESAKNIRRYLKHFLTSPEGAFYTSQDADVVQGEHSAEFFSLEDAARRKIGIPRVDTHIYARENGLAVAGLASLYAASGEAAALEEAKRAAEWIIKHRSLRGGGFRHDETDNAGPYLADSLAMARAFLQLHVATAERAWLARAQETAAFMHRTFKDEAGYDTASPVSNAPFRAKPQVDENIMLARFANLLHHYTGDVEARSMADHAMHFLTAPATIDGRGYGVSGILMAERECATEPQHITIVGAKDDPSARALFHTALLSPVAYKRVEWFDEREGPMLRADVNYPDLPQAAAFFCADGRCSAPIKTVEALEKKLATRR